MRWAGYVLLLVFSLLMLPGVTMGLVTIALGQMTRRLVLGEMIIMPLVMFFPFWGVYASCKALIGLWRGAGHELSATPGRVFLWLGGLSLFSGVSSIPTNPDNARMLAMFFFVPGAICVLWGLALRPSTKPPALP